jgi:SAM-dependent methyltransferase
MRQEQQQEAYDNCSNSHRLKPSAASARTKLEWNDALQEQHPAIAQVNAIGRCAKADASWMTGFPRNTFCSAMSQDPQRPEGFFEGTEMPTAGWWEALWRDPAAVLAAVGIGPGMDVIDLCSGDGWFTLQIARIVRHVIAIDIDRNLLEIGRHRLQESNVANYDLVVANAYDVAEIAPQRVDFVFLANAFHGVPDQLRLARSVRQALKPSGRLAIVNWHRRPREETMVLGEPRGPRTELRMSPEQTMRAIEPAGLKPAFIVELPPYHYGAVFER